MTLQQLRYFLAVADVRSFTRAAELVGVERLRGFGDALYVPIFFGIVLGGWILKFVVFLIALFVLRDQPWIVGPVFFLALVASVLASLAIDVVVLLRMRVPHVSDVDLPTDPDAGDRTDDRGTGL